MIAHGILCQFGCGLSAPDGWVNFDSSPRLRMERFPGLRRLIPPGPFGRFPPAVRYGDIVKGLPLPPSSVRLLYSSHVLEHLSLSDLRTALRNSFALLAPGGIFRSVMPDLAHLVRRYCDDSDDGAGERFLMHSGLGALTRPRGVAGHIKEVFGNSQHRWLWDYKGIAKELCDAGFVKVRQAAFGDSGVPDFGLVESEDRWRHSLGFECRKPV